MRLFILLMSLLLSLSASAGEIIRDPATVKAIFSNKTVDAYHLKRETAWTNYFAADGTMRRITEDGDRHTGKWHINDRAEHCVNWSHINKEWCVAIKTGNRKGIYFRVKIKGDRQTKKVKFRNFRDGDQLGK